MGRDNGTYAFLVVSSLKHLLHEKFIKAKR